MISALLAALPSSVVAAECSVVKFADFPITMRGLRPTMVASINGVEQTFIADSGAFFSVISPGTARDLGLKLVPPPFDIRMVGIGGEASIQVATVKAFSISGRTIANVEFIVGGSEPGTAGVIGQNILGRADVEYDLPHGVIRLMQTKACQKANLAYWLQAGQAYSEMPIADLKTARFHTEGTIRINDASIHAIFDTGAETTMLSLRAAARAGLTPDMPGAKPGGLGHGFGRGSVASWIVPVKVIKIGDEELKNAKVRIGDIGNVTDMLIGADFFISHRVFVSNAQHKLYFSYTGGPVFDLSAHLAGAAPVSAQTASTAAQSNISADAATFSRSAAVAAAQHDKARAIADVSQAIALAPGEPRFLHQRAMLYRDGDQAALALADVDKAIALKPDDIETRTLRAELRLEEKNDAAALEDIDAAAAAVGQAADQRLALANLYEEAGALDKGIQQSTLWITNHPVDAKKGMALNSRCWMRALSGKDLPMALSDCTAALRLMPKTAQILDSRGLVYLRMGEYDKAMSDYGAALAVNPRIAWSLYGRSRVERRKGMAIAAKADLEAAAAIDPDLPGLAAKYGIDE